MEIVLTVIFGMLGAVIGSFLNVCIDRLPSGKSLVYPPSACDACQRRLSWLDLFPVFSYLFLRGRCRFCQAHILQRVFWVELSTGLLFAFLYLHYGLAPELPLTIFYGSVLIVLALIDLEHKLILNKIVYPVAVIAIIINIFLPEFGLKSFLYGLLGGAIGFIILFLPALIYSKGMGWGDVKMAGLIGLMVGFPRVFVAVIGGIILGGLVALLLLLLKKKGRKDGIPFGPFLALATMAAIFWGNPILNWYLSLF
ncbi:MAG: prepilin peptidase [Dehalococcoidales bacterium]|nr:prepilin peptidase [Dehalococcoidales bacterium]